MPYNDIDYVPYDELFDSQFMSWYTNFDSFFEFLEIGNIRSRSKEDIDYMLNVILAYISRFTYFSNWKQMLGTAEEEYMLNKN